ncbi:hypothetical protein SynBIOSE41_03859 [Synechococcus sp. BIOS-E4-1]|nr:hypothetical protein SynBIOSE41_03859 [Synechococcus sp. BIOS-E4-1]
MLQNPCIQQKLYSRTGRTEDRSRDSKQHQYKYGNNYKQALSDMVKHMEAQLANCKL